MNVHRKLSVLKIGLDTKSATSPKCVFVNDFILVPPVGLITRTVKTRNCPQVWEGTSAGAIKGRTAGSCDNDDDHHNHDRDCR